MYVGNFIVLAQGSPADPIKVRDHIFASIDRVFRPNVPVKKTRQDPNSLNNIKKGSVAWTLQKRVIRCILNTLSLMVLFPSLWLQKFRADLAELPPTQRCTSHRKWSLLVGILYIIVPDLIGIGSLFSHLQSSFRGGNGCLCLSSQVHTDIQDWGHLLSALSSSTTHLQEIFHQLPSWHDIRGACQHGLNGVFWGPYGVPHLWHAQLPPALLLHLI